MSSAPPRTIKFRRPWLYPKQEQAIFYPRDPSGDIARYGLIEASTKAGKTIGCIAWQLEQALMSKPGSNHWWIAPVLGQSLIAFTRLRKMLTPGTFEYRLGPPIVTTMNGAHIWFKSGDHPDSLYGEDVFSAVIDEASRVPEDSFIAVRTTLTATRGPMRIIGNVKGRRNWFYALARKAEAGAEGMAYAKLVAADAVEAGVLSAKEIADAKRILADHVFRELYLAEPSEDGGNPFGGDAAIAAVTRDLSTGRPMHWGWDLAKSVDYTVGIALDIDGNACRFHRFQKPWTETISFIQRETGRTKALVDSTGVGDPILEALQADGHSNFLGYKFSSPSKQKLMEGLAVAIQRQEITIPPGVVEKELQVFEYEYHASGVRYSAPEGFHDDTVCALALANESRTSNKTASTWRKLAAQMN